MNYLRNYLEKYKQYPMLLRIFAIVSAIITLAYSLFLIFGSHEIKSIMYRSLYFFPAYMFGIVMIQSFVSGNYKLFIPFNLSLTLLFLVYIVSNIYSFQNHYELAKNNPYNRYDLDLELKVFWAGTIFTSIWVLLFVFYPKMFKRIS